MLINSMTKYRPTISAIRLFVALALLFSVSAPLVEYVCGEEKESLRLTELHGATTTHNASCTQEKHGNDVPIPLCGEVQHAATECEVVPCTVEPDKQVLAVISEKPTLRIDLVPAPLIERVSSEVFFSSPSIVRWSAETPGGRILVPVRLLTSTFLL